MRVVGRRAAVKQFCIVNWLVFEGVEIFPSGFGGPVNAESWCKLPCILMIFIRQAKKKGVSKSF